MAVKKNTEVENVEVTETVEKEAVNVLDLLLGSDLGTIKQPHKDMEITRLSEALGAPFVVRCEALSPDTYEEVLLSWLMRVRNSLPNRKQSRQKRTDLLRSVLRM